LAPACPLFPYTTLFRSPPPCWSIRCFSNRQTDFTILFDINHFHFNFITNRKIIINVLYIVIGNLTDMNESGWTFLQFDKRSKVRNTGYLSLQFAAYFNRHKKMLLLKNFNQWTCRLPEVKKYFHFRAYRGMVINFIYIYIIVLIMKACQYAGSSSGSVKMISPSSEKK